MDRIGRGTGPCNAGSARGPPGNDSKPKCFFSSHGVMVLLDLASHRQGLRCSSKYIETRPRYSCPKPPVVYRVSSQKDLATMFTVTGFCDPDHRLIGDTICAESGGECVRPTG